MKKFVIIGLAVVLFMSCSNSGSDKQSGGEEAGTISITAAGATFPMPYYNLAFKEYTEKTGVLLTYGGIGSGGGIRSLKDKVVDFGATDTFLDAKAEAEMSAEIVHIPTCIGEVVVAYNLPGVEGLMLTNQNMEEIFMGKITKWNDGKLKASNPQSNLPDMAITVVYRSDGSGTTHIFSDYMCKISTNWEQSIGSGKALNWPVGMGAKGNPGVAGIIQQTAGAIGYIGSEFAFAQKISYARIENSTGNYISPSLESVSAAAQGEIPVNTKIMLTNSSDSSAYPICGFTWIILYKEQNYNGRSKAQAEATVKFLSWMIDIDAQKLAEQVNYSSLPEKAVAKANEVLKSVTYSGGALLK